MLTLVPTSSRLATLTQGLVDRHGAADSLVAIGPRGLDFVALRSWCAARQRGRASVLWLVSPPELLIVLDRLERMDLRFRLPAGSVVVEFQTGFADDLESPQTELLPRLTTRLGVAPSHVVRAYLPPELEAPIYSATLAGGDSKLFIPTTEMTIQVVDPATQIPRDLGEAGQVVIVAASGESRATRDLGALEAGGLRLLGRLSA